MAISATAQAYDYVRDFANHYFSFWKENADRVCDDEEDIQEKIVIVTGSNTGIGKQIAFQLAKRGAIVIMAVRNLEKGQIAMRDIKNRLENPELKIEVMKVDLGDLQSIRDFVLAIQTKYHHINILVNNAGLMDPNPEVKKTKDGFEQHIGVNHLGPFLLTRLLLPSLQKAPTPSRIICMTSSNLAIAPLNFMDDLMMTKDIRTGDNGREQYSVSNICSAICMAKLANDNGDVFGKQVKLVQLCPGLVKSDVFRHESGLMRNIRNGITLTAVGLSPHQGSETAVFCALSKSLGENENSGRGEIYRFKKVWQKGDQILKGYLTPPRLATADKLYKLSEELVGL